jgi:hypothetical protein
VSSPTTNTFQLSDLGRSFFKKPDYEVKVAKYTDANKEPIAISELLTATLVPLEPKLFKGAAMVLPLPHLNA